MRNATYLMEPPACLHGHMAKTPNNGDTSRWLPATKWLVISAVLMLAGCSTPSSRNGTADAIEREMDAAARSGVKPS